MDIYDVREFFMWCSIINGLLMVFMFLIRTFVLDWAYKIHSNLYSISREMFNIAVYSFFGLYKFFFFMFNLIPFLACSIVTR